MRTTILGLLIFLFLPAPAFASPVISEVMWMGSDLSTADEWLEIYNPESFDIDLSGWSVTSVNSSSKEVVSLIFETGSVIAAGEYLVIASKTSANSRLLDEPYAVSSALSLPNTKLLVRLRDGEQTVIDEVDDGVGSPFSGSNPSGSEGKASMQRINPHASGTQKENWTTSTLSLGFDPGVMIFGTPGFSAESDTEPDPEEEPKIPPPSPPQTSDCTDPLEIAIAVQSGPLVAVGKATVNFQAVATVGSLSGVACSWSYGDGFSSASCNPPVHSFIGAGTYRVRLEAKNQCDITLQQEQIVEVLPDPKSLTSSSQQAVWYDGSRLVLKGALPNPVGTDTGKEWIEIKNLEQKAVDLRGWKLAIGETSIRLYLLKDSIGPSGTFRLYDSELKFTLPNTTSKVQLIAPNGVVLSSIPWKAAEEDRTYFSDDIRSLTVRGRVLRVTGPTTFMIELDGDASAAVGSDIATVRILDIELNPVRNSQENPSEYLRALIENKYIELQFGTDTWDDMGRLIADAVIDGRIVLRDHLLMSKIWIQDSALKYNENEESYLASFIPEIVQGISLLEVYPAPFPAPKDGSLPDWKNKEWLEIDNNNQHAVDLSGWKIVTSKSEKSLPEGLKIASGSRLVVYASSIGLSLRNAGDSIRLVSAQGTLVSTLEYPQMKNGTAFAVDSTGNCTTIEPTPGSDNVCVKQVMRTRSAIAKSVAAKKSTAKVKAFAASYRAQSVSDTDDVQEILILQGPQPQSSIIMAVFTFVLGLCIAFALFIFFTKKNLGKVLLILSKLQ